MKCPAVDRARQGPAPKGNLSQATRDPFCSQRIGRKEKDQGPHTALLDLSQNAGLGPGGLGTVPAYRDTQQVPELLGASVSMSLSSLYLPTHPST